jgi:transcriptional regulator with XRE-family HTH domain
MGTGRNIANARKQRGLTQKELAAKVRITREYLASIETEKERVSKRTLAVIAYYLEVEIGELLIGS